MNVDRVLSVHFPKAAGTSLGRLLEALLPGGSVTDYAHDPITWRGTVALPFPAGARTLHGHFRPDCYDAAGAFLVTFLREPAENLVSIYSYWRATPEHGNPVHTRFLAEKPDLLAFARYPDMERLMSGVYFGGFDMKRFDFVGFHHRRDDDLRRLGGLIGLPLQADIHHNRTEAKLRVDDATMTRLRGLLSDDVAFYRRMLDARP